MWRRWQERGCVESGSRPGRPRCTSVATDEAIVQEAKEEAFTSPRKVRRKLELDASPDTIDRRLRKVGLFPSTSTTPNRGG